MSIAISRWLLPATLLTAVAAALLLLAPTTAAAWPGCEVDRFSLSVSGHTVTVNHDAAAYNCCLDHVAQAVEWNGSVLAITETEVFVGPSCPCLCCYSLSVEVADCPPGELTVEVHWHDGGGVGWTMWTGTIDVPDVGQSAVPTVADLWNSACLDMTGADEPELRPWSILKAWYRLPPRP